jgi:hypothetical protein
VFLRFELIRGKLMKPDYDRELQLVRDCLTKEAKPHFQEFLAAWEVAETG